jgi:hypothetical protein
MLFSFDLRNIPFFLIYQNHAYMGQEARIMSRIYSGQSINCFAKYLRIS